jgi:hypothetical protein
VFENLSAVLAHPSDLEKVPAMLADAQEKQAATGGALSELIAMHCSHLRLGLEEMVTAISDMDTVRKRLDIIRELCKRSDVLTPSESAHAATLSTVQVCYVLDRPRALLNVESLGSCLGNPEVLGF